MRHHIATLSRALIDFPSTIELDRFCLDHIFVRFCRVRNRLKQKYKRWSHYLEAHNEYFLRCSNWFPEVVNISSVTYDAITYQFIYLTYWMEAKRSMSDEEFYKMMKQNLMK